MKMIVAIFLSCIAVASGQLYDWWTVVVPRNGSTLTLEGNSSLVLNREVGFSTLLTITVTSGEIEVFSGITYWPDPYDPTIAKHTVLNAANPKGIFQDKECGNGTWWVQVRTYKGKGNYTVKAENNGPSKVVNIGDTVTSPKNTKDVYAYHLLKVPKDCTDFTVLVESNNLSVSAFIPQGACGTSIAKPNGQCDYGTHPTIGGVVDHYYVEFRCASAGTYSLEVYSSDNKTLDYTLSITSGIKNCDANFGCSGYNGKCVNGKCRCSTPFTGANCDQIDSKSATQLVDGANTLKFTQQLHSPYSYAYAYMYGKGVVGTKNVVVTQKEGFLLNAFSENYESLIASNGHSTNSIEIPNFYASSLVVYQVFYERPTFGNATTLQVEIVDRTLTVPSTTTGTFSSTGPVYRVFRLAAPVSQDLRVVYQGSGLNGLFLIKDKDTIFGEEKALITPKTTEDYMGVSAKGVVDCATCDYYVYAVGTEGSDYSISTYLSSAACKGGCGDNGFCVKDTCRCAQGYSGATCQTAPTAISINKKTSIATTTGTWYQFTIPSGSVFNILGLKNFDDSTYFYKVGNDQAKWYTNSSGMICQSGTFMIYISSSADQSIYINSPTPTGDVPAAVNFASMATSSNPATETFHYLVDLPYVPASSKVTVTLAFDAYDSSSSFYASFGYSSTCANGDADYMTAGSAPAAGGTYTLELPNCKPGDWNLYFRVNGARNVKITKSVSAVSSNCSLVSNGAINSAYCGSMSSATVIDPLITSSCPISNHVRAADEFIQFYVDSYIDVPYFPVYGKGYTDYICYNKYATTKSNGQIVQPCPNDCYSFVGSAFTIGQVKPRYTCDVKGIVSSNTVPTSCPAYPPRYGVIQAPVSTGTVNTGLTGSNEASVSSACIAVASTALLMLLSVLAF